MKKVLILIFGVAILFGIRSPGIAQMADINETSTVADNWIKLIIAETGSWGIHNTATPEPMVEFKRNERLLGYLYPVNPSGYILISLRKELAPVKAYSATGSLNPLSDEGMADLLKVCLERILDTIEQKLGTIEMVNTTDLEKMVEINYKPAWSNLLKSNPVIKTKNKEKSKDNYEEGDILLSSDWHQSPPYNDDCPWMDCPNSNGRAIVGCVATAGAQIMHYWNWPPYGSGAGYSDTYDWPNMPDAATTSSPQAEIDALAELNHEVGVAVGMSYGCSSSGAYTYNMVGVFENNYRYSTSCVVRNRPSYSAATWFAMMQTQFNQNRPVQYRIPGHSIVGDGWQIIGSSLKMYHMNYGWMGTGDDVWYILDALQGGNPSEEYMLEDIVPVQAMDNWVTGTYYTPSFPYRYFDKDALGSDANFGSGHFLQFLPEIILSGISPTLPVRFNGSPSYNTRLFTAGDVSTGIRIYNGAIEMTNFGSIKLYEE
ncbi:MAG: C10 family peptidase [Bacteroidetes bacterium]|nr:C10 family peptidase [Bacteroidota bacterium]MBL7102835.1 C10 family peptidase [Bacteroidales bacterium]